jgi:integrase/recombinase XerC
MLLGQLSDITWQEAIDLFAVDRGDLSSSTIKCYREFLRKFADSCGCSVHQVGRIHIARFLSKYSGRTAYNYYLSAIKSFFEWYSDCYDCKNVAAKIRCQKAAGFKVQRCLAREEYRKIFAHSGKARDVVVFLCNTGLRLQELAEIEPSHFDREHRALTVFGKGGKYRIVPLNSIAYDLCVKYHLKFTKSKWTVVNSLKYLSRRLAIPSFSAHACRRYFATRAIDKGANIALVAKVLGHSSVQTTVRYYYFPKELESVTNLLLSDIDPD